MKKELLEIEVRLLIHKYGYTSVLGTLASIKESTIEEIESLLAAIEQRGNRPKTKKQKSNLDIAEEIIKDSEHYEALKKLALDYHNKRFLPQLKDVKRLLERSGIDAGTIKSRVLATKKVFELIRGFDLRELEEMVPSHEGNEESAFSALAREIIGGPVNMPSNQANSTDAKK